MAGSASDASSGASHPTGTLPASSPLVPVGSRNRRSSMASSDSPVRNRRESMSAHQPPSPALNLAAAASVNASMRAGSPGPENTTRDSAASRRKSVVADLIMADDALPPAAEIAVGDRKAGTADMLNRVPSLSLRDSGLTSQTVSSNPFGAGSRGSVSGSPRMTGSEPNWDAMNTADPFHKRAPSVGEVHQQMEQEQEAQVNRLLIQIHQQQMQIDALKRQNPTATSFPIPPSTADSDTFAPPLPAPFATPGSHSVRPPPTPERAHSSGSASTTTASTMPASKIASATSSSRPTRSGSPLGVGLRSSSRASSRPTTPKAQTMSQGAYMDTDEKTKYWQGEAAKFERENQQLKAQIKDMERQLRGQTHDDMETTAPLRSSSLATESMSIDG